jgi:hypothetical protein
MNIKSMFSPLIILQFLKEQSVFRVTPTPCHSEEATEKFVEALKDAWIKFMPLLSKFENDFARKVKSL